MTPARAGCLPSQACREKEDRFVMPAKAGIQKGGRVAQDRSPCVYILASQRNGTLYVGVTSNLIQRVWQHKNDAIEGFTTRYGVKILVYMEIHATMPDAILREKQIKRWKRAWKLALIERDNPGWRDLYDEVAGVARPGGIPPMRT